MKSYYDLSKSEQIMLQKEFRRKWGTNKKIMVWLAFSVLFGCACWLIGNEDYEDFFLLPILCATNWLAIGVAVISIAEYKAFRIWLKGRNILK